ncbi:MAG: thiamine pyrophosphate-dependent dehydrogenase E1 component subunit alpha [Ardenticatenaceae bacterium]|nr:thiamine pyrophosphate-dependent dehydrogenase E1 component subunit alpha [Ardenticatenaceae bacterium]
MHNRDWLLNLHRQMLTIRKFEETASELYTAAIMPGLAHLYIGQEAVAVGVCAALRPDDYITSTHRGHGHCLAKGAQVDRMFAELLGKAAGFCRGKGGSMHIADPDVGNLGANGIVGGSMAIAAGAALSALQRGTDQVVVCFFGDGALNQGLLLESMNLAVIWKLPVIYVCENNLYGEYTPMSAVMAGPTITLRGEAFGIPSKIVDGQDVLGVYESATEAVVRARAGQGPTFLVCNTYRYHGHHVGDQQRSYRSREEEHEWQTQRDPIACYAHWLLSEGHVTQGDLERVEADIEREIKTGMEFAKAAPFPLVEEVSLHVYA